MITSSLQPYFHNVICMFICFGVVLGLVSLLTSLNRANKISSVTSRKLTHILTGPVFLILWFIFDEAWHARFFAAFVPFAMMLKFGLVGLGIVHDPETIRTITRFGDRKELLMGPVSYGAIFVTSTILYWRTSSASVVSLMVLCVGDGLSGLIGPIYGTIKLPWNRQKSVQGSLSFLFGSHLSSLLFVSIFHFFGFVKESPSQSFFAVTITTLICALIESMPVENWDNITVFLSSMISMYIFG